jgi:hypothetical protein
MGTYTRFAIRYDGWFRKVAGVMGLGPGVSLVSVGPSDLRVRMGWGFQTRIDRSAIGKVVRHTGALGGIGVHGWGGIYLVNGSMNGVVRIEIKDSSPQRARCTGLPVKLRTLMISLEDPDGFQAALGF